MIKTKIMARNSSLETQGQILEARESLNGRKNIAQRKVKNSEKSPWEPSDRKEKHKSFLAPIRSQNGGDRLELVW